MVIVDYSPLFISLKIAGLATFIDILIGIYLAYVVFFLPRRIKLLVDTMLTIPLVLPPTVIGFLLLFLLSNNTVVGQILSNLNISIIFTWWAGVIAGVLVTFTLAYKIIFNTFELMETELIDMAQSLGASRIDILTQILLPLSTKGIVAAIVLSFARIMGEFGATFMVAGNLPGQTQTMAMTIFIEASAGNMTVAFVWVLIMSLIACAILIVINYGSSLKVSINYQWGKLIGNWLIYHRSSLTETEKSKESPHLIFDFQKQLSPFTLSVTGKISSSKVALLGASGAGKSMFLKCIAGLETPNQGQIALNGKILFDKKHEINIPAHQRKIGLVLQNYALFPHLTVKENIAFGLQKTPLPWRHEIIQYYLNLVELSNYQDYYPHQLSGGQKQRVALARALAIEPEAILLDEPLSALDSYLRSRIEQLLAKTLVDYQGVAIFVTHKLEEAYRLCDRLFILSAGKIIAEGAKEDIFHHPPNYRTAKVTECKNFSSITIIDYHTIKAHDWNCQLTVIKPIQPLSKYIAFRAHHCTFPEDNQRPNTFPCWLVKISETQHRVTLFLHLNHPADNSGDHYHLQAEVYREKWEQLKIKAFPWYVCLSADKLILLSE